MSADRFWLRRQPPSGSVEKKKAQLYGNPGLYLIFNQLANAFQKQFGTILCRDITRPWHGDWFARDRLKTCLKTVAFMAETAATMVFPPDRDYWGSQLWGVNLLDKPTE